MAMTKIYPQCQMEFVAHRRDQTYCSERCQKSNFYRWGAGAYKVGHKQYSLGALNVVLARHEIAIATRVTDPDGQKCVVVECPGRKLDLAVLQ